MSNTTKGYPYPEDTDAADVPSDVQLLAEAIDAAPGIASLTQAQIDALPAALKWAGRVVWNQTGNKLQRSNGSAFADVPTTADVAVLSSDTPQATGAAAAGAGATAARGDHVHALGTSPALTGTPTAPSAAADTSTTQIATTAFVVGQAATANPPMDGTAAPGTSLRYARQDHVHASDTSKVGTSDSRLSDTRTPTDGSVSTAKIADGAVTSAKIADGTIVDGDVNASAAIAQSKISGLTASLAAKADAAPVQNAQTGTAYTLALADASKLVTLSNALAVTVTLPLEATVAWPTGTQLRLLNQGAGTVTVAGAVGVTINGTPLTLTQYKGATLIKTGTNVWSFLPFSSGVGAAEFSDAATGTYTGYKYKTFTASGTLTVTTGGFADLVIIGGGGAGGGRGGGGGAGGYLAATVYLSAGTHTVTIPGGGALVAGDTQGNYGGAARIGTYFVPGGGGGGSINRAGSGGGSGGGGASTTQAGGAGDATLGNNGGAGGAAVGEVSGGGGGASAVGGAAAGTVSGNGGAGTTTSIAGTTPSGAYVAGTYALGGGGGGGAAGSATAGSGGSGGGGAGGKTGAATAGTANTGGGGGGAGGSTSNLNSGAGGSGIVIVRVAV